MFDPTWYVGVIGKFDDLAGHDHARSGESVDGEQIVHRDLGFRRDTAERIVLRHDVGEPARELTRPHRDGGASCGEVRELGARNLAGADARGADVHSLGGSTDTGTNRLDVRVEPTVGAAVGVADALAEDRSLVADVADGGHERAS